MRIEHDIFSEIGSSHKVCEDHIIKGDNPVPYIIISDGCSSSKDTDMGSKILCHLAKNFIMKCEKFPLDENTLANWVIYNAEGIANQLGLKRQCLDATLIVAYYYDGFLHSHFYGDGCLITKLLDGTVIINSISYTPEMPFYLSYLLSNKEYDKYINANVIKKRHIYNMNTGEYTEGDAWIKIPINFLHEDQDEYISVFTTDGLESFMDSNNDLLHPHEIIEEMISFKNIKGEFLKRRMNRYTKKLSEQNIHHFDDLSIGAFIIER